MTVRIHSCVVCDLVRPELNGKLIILGFLGVCPHVEIRLPQLDRPIPLTFLLTGSMPTARVQLAVEVLRDDTQRLVAATGMGTFELDGLGGPVNIAPSLLLTFGHAGAYVVRCLADGEECFRSTFSVLAD